MSTNNDPQKAAAAQREHAIETIINEIIPFHNNKDKCPREILVENLMIDFEMNDTNTLIAIASAITELKVVIGRLAENSGKLFD